MFAESKRFAEMLCNIQCDNQGWIHDSNEKLEAAEISFYSRTLRKGHVRNGGDVRRIGTTHKYKEKDGNYRKMRKEDGENSILTWHIKCKRSGV